MGGGFGMGAGWLFGLLLLAGVVTLIVVGVRFVRGGTGDSAARPSTVDRSAGARQIVEERYARGELSTEEYQERRRNLGDGS